MKRRLSETVAAAWFSKQCRGSGVVVVVLAEGCARDVNKDLDEIVHTGESSVRDNPPEIPHREGSPLRAKRALLPGQIRHARR
jgi:hypothetical protein